MDIQNLETPFGELLWGLGGRVLASDAGRGEEGVRCGVVWCDVVVCGVEWCGFMGGALRGARGFCGGDAQSGARVNVFGFLVRGVAAHRRVQGRRREYRRSLQNPHSRTTGVCLCLSPCMVLTNARVLYVRMCV